MAVCACCDHAAEKLCVGCREVFYCSKKCQVSHWKVHKPTCTSSKNKEKNNCESKIESNHLQTVTKVKDIKKPLSSPIKIESKDKCYKIVAIPGKGMGILAQRAIKYGELIMNEQPISRLKSKVWDIDTLNVDTFKQLPESQVNELLQLFNCSSVHSHDIIGKTRILGNIWSKYAFKFSGETGVFKDISRLNHSCIPNAERNFTNNGMRIFAIQDIEKDAEICIEYNTIFGYEKPPTISLVKSKLKSVWNFDCNCELCGDIDTKSRQIIENNRIQYWKLCRTAEIEALENDNELLATTCEKIITQMSCAKYWSIIDKWMYGSKGIQATLNVLNMPLREKKRRTKYFLPIVEKAFNIVEGVDGPNTIEKNDLEDWKIMCKAINRMNEREYRALTRSINEEFQSLALN